MSSEATAAASSADAAAAAPAASSAAASSGGLSFSFASRAPRRVVHTQPAAAAAPADSQRQVISGVLTANSLAATHAASQDSSIGKSALVIPLIKTTNWRTNSATVAQSHLLPPSSAVQSIAREGAAAAGKSAGVSFESEADILEQQRRDNDSAAAAAAAASPPDDSPPPLQSASGALLSDSSIDAQALAALERSAMEVDEASSDLPSLEQQDAFARAAPILVQNALPGNHKMLTEEQRIALDVEQRPSSPSVEDYGRVPIDEFGAGMLRGMGWKGLGDAIGGINKAVVQPVQFAPRGERMGVGAEFSKARDNRGPKKHIKPGEVREASGVVRPAAAAAGPSVAELKAKTLRSLGSRLIQVHSQQLSVGKLCEVMDGAHRRQYGRIVSHEDSALFGHADDTPMTLRLNLSGESVSLLRGQVDLLDERVIPEDHPAFDTPEKVRERKEKQQAAAAASQRAGADKEESKQSSSSSSKRDRSERDSERDGSSSKRARKDRSRSRSRSRSRTDKSRSSHSSSHRQRSRSRSRDRHHSRDDRRSQHSSTAAAAASAASSSSSSSSRPVWIRPHIRVRFISRSGAGAKFYSQKATVLDVSSARCCVLRPDSAPATVIEVQERDLETVLPKAGERVMVLQGELRGSVGKLLQRQAEKSIAVVQLDEDLNIVQCSFDDVAEVAPGR